MPILALNLAVLVGVSTLIVVVGAAARQRERSQALGDNKFLTTEWHLMKKLKEETDLKLGAKDREIDELKRRYLALKASGSPAELLASIEEEMRKVEAERRAILSSRIAAVVDPPKAAAMTTAAAASSAAVPPPAGPAGAAVPPAAEPIAAAKESPVVELLGERLKGLEAELASRVAVAASLESDLAALRRSYEERSRSQAADSGQGAAAAPAAAPEAANATTPATAANAAREADARAIEALVAALERERSSIGEGTDSMEVSDLKTGALLRAIVRTPAIRAQYPDLLESLDRYLKLVASAEYLKGKRDAYDEMIEDMGGVEGK